MERHLRYMDTQKREDPAAAGPGKCTVTEGEHAEQEEEEILGRQHR